MTIQKDVSKIPHGEYCYDEKLCPYWRHRKIKGASVVWCDFLEEGGLLNAPLDKRLVRHFGSEDAVYDAFPLYLLWDQCKECGKNMEEKE